MKFKAVTRWECRLPQVTPFHMQKWTEWFQELKARLGSSDIWSLKASRASLSVSFVKGVRDCAKHVRLMDVRRSKDQNTIKLLSLVGGTILAKRKNWMQRSISSSTTLIFIILNGIQYIGEGREGQPDRDTSSNWFPIAVLTCESESSYGLSQRNTTKTPPMPWSMGFTHFLF